MVTRNYEGRLYEGGLMVNPKDRYGIVVARFNHAITDLLLEGAVDALLRHGVNGNNIDVVRVPGCFEIPYALKKLGSKNKGKPAAVKALIALGAVIKGSTAHFDYVSSAVTQGCQRASDDLGIPVIFGVLTTDTVEQAQDRAGIKLGNKGFEAACTAIEMLSLDRDLALDKNHSKP